MARQEKNMDSKKKLLEERVVSISRVTKVTKGGRHFRFAATMAVGDGKGLVGIGTGKANEVPDAIRKGIEDAKKNLINVKLINGSLPHANTGTFGAGEVFVRPASEGTGVIAGGAIRDIMELAGVTDVLTKCIGSRTPINMIRATFNALDEMKTVEQVAALREIKVQDVR